MDGTVECRTFRLELDKGYSDEAVGYILDLLNKGYKVSIPKRYITIDTFMVEGED